MLSLLSRIVIGGDCEECEAPEDDQVFQDSSQGSEATDDTDEELLSPPMPIINIDQTELAEDALHAQSNTSRPSSLGCSDSSEEVGEDDVKINKDTETLAPLVLPGKDVCRRILELVEYYLSDHNLVKDMFILKHITKHREGYISIKLLASYKKVKRLTKDWRVVAHALKDSSALEVNQEGTKVRRRKALPQEVEEDTKPFRMLLTTGIPKEQANMNNMADYFAKFGEIISLQLHKPGGRSLQEVRQAEHQNPGISNTICALVEYEKVHYARQAFRFINNNAESNMKAVEIPRKKHDTISLPGTRTSADGESAYYSASDASECPTPVKGYYRLRSFGSSQGSTPNISPIVMRRQGRPLKQQQQWQHKQQSSPESSPPSPFSSRRGPPTPSSSPENRPVSSQEKSFPYYPSYEVPGSTPLPRRQLVPRTLSSTPNSPTLRRHVRNANENNNNSMNNNKTSPMPLSPWLRRRVASVLNSNGTSSVGSTPSASPCLRRRQYASLFVPENVTRQPRGPDGTRGFTQRHTIVNAQA